MLIEKDITCFPQFSNMRDGYVFEYNKGEGFFLYCFYNNVTDHELQCHKAGSPFKITFTELYRCGFLTLKFGDLELGDCVFDPRLYAERDRDFTFDELTTDENLGAMLNIIVIEPNKGGLVRNIRTLSLGNSFSRKFVDWCKKTAEEKITIEENRKIVDTVFSRYSSRDLEKMSKMYWRTQE